MGHFEKTKPKNNVHLKRKNPGQMHKKIYMYSAKAQIFITSRRRCYQGTRRTQKNKYIGAEKKFFSATNNQSHEHTGERKKIKKSKWAKNKQCVKRPQMPTKHCHPVKETTDASKTGNHNSLRQFHNKTNFKQ